MECVQGRLRGAPRLPLGSRLQQQLALKARRLHSPPLPRPHQQPLQHVAPLHLSDHLVGPEPEAVPRGGTLGRGVVDGAEPSLQREGRTGRARAGQPLWPRPRGGLARACASCTKGTSSRKVT